MNLCPATFYRKRRQFRNGGVLPRKKGNGCKRKYFARDYEQLFKEILTTLPPVAGHKRIWVQARKRGVTFSQGTCYRLLKELSLLAPRPRGWCRKRYEPLEVDGPNQIYVVDTTIWYMGRRRVNIYAAIDAYSRYVPALKAFFDKTAESTIEYFDETFEGSKPASVHTDNGTEFVNNRTTGYLELRQVMWRHGPSHTPEAQGLIARFNRSLKEECLIWEEPTDILQLQKCLDKYRDWYNRVRDHSAIGDRPPEEVHYAKNS